MAYHAGQGYLFPRRWHEIPPVVCLLLAGLSGALLSFSRRLWLGARSVLLAPNASRDLSWFFRFFFF
jgi:hypothetical protein